MYYLLILIILIFHFLWTEQSGGAKEKCENKLALLICLVLVILAAFRSDSVGADTPGYRLEYLTMSGFHSIQDIVDRYTYDYLGYYCLAKLFSLLGLPVEVWFGFVEALYLYAMMSLINRYSKDKIFSILVFTTIGLYSFSMAGLKQTMAMSFMMLAFIAMIEKRYWVTALLVFLTYYTHQSALIFLGAFPLYYIRKVRLLVPISLLLCVLIYYYNIFFMQAMVDSLENERWEKYLVTDSGYSYVTLIFYAVITFIAGINIKRYHAKDPAFSYLFFSLSILGCGLQFLASISPSLFRLAYLYTPAMMILLPNASYYSINPKVTRIVLMACIIFYFLYTNRAWPYSFKFLN